MTDIALKYDGKRFDIALGSDGDLLHDDGLENAMILSLFCDRRAGDNDPLPYEDADKRGWWADQFADVDGDLIGSLLWLLARAKQTNDNVNRARIYTTDATQWFIDDDVAESVEVESAIVREEVLGVRAAVIRPGEVAPQWERVWEVQLNG